MVFLKVGSTGGLWYAHSPNLHHCDLESMAGTNRSKHAVPILVSILPPYWWPYLWDTWFRLTRGSGGGRDRHL